MPKNSQTESIRKEQDSLGTIDVPATALYGGQTARALANFQISGRTASPALIRAYLKIKAAAAIANGKCGALSHEHASLIVKAVEELLRKPESEWPSIFPVDLFQAGAGTSQNMNVNEVVANVANRIVGKPIGTYKPIHPNDHVNRSQSTNDSYPTAMRLSLLEASAPLVVELEKLSVSLTTKAKSWAGIAKSARTHLQDAVPMTLGQEFSAYAATTAKCARWIEASREELRELGIGGSAAGTGLTVPKGYGPAILAELARLTGENLRLNPNLFEAMQSQAPVSHYSSMLRIAGLEMTRICNDLRLLASGPMTGFSEILLPAVQPGSSIMPGKVNPSIIEMANQAWFSVLGHDQTVAHCVQAGQLELNVMMPIMAHSALEATHVATNATRTLRERCVDGIQANKARCRSYFEGTPQVATALSPRLGYEKTAELVKESLAQGKSIIQLIREKKLISEDELAVLLEIRAITGG